MIDESTIRLVICIVVFVVAFALSATTFRDAQDMIFRHRNWPAWQVALKAAVPWAGAIPIILILLGAVGHG